MPTPAEPPCTTCGESTRFRVEYLKRDTSVPQLRTRDLDTQAARTTLELDPCKQKRVRTELVLRPREVVKEVTECTFQPVTKRDPITGCETVVLQPVTEVKRVAIIVYDLCPEEVPVTVTTFGLKPKTETVVERRLGLDCVPEKRTETRGVLLPTIRKERLIDPGVPCARDESIAPHRQ
jgi:hypothetical protein